MILHVHVIFQTACLALLPGRSQSFFWGGGVLSLELFFPSRKWRANISGFLLGVGNMKRKVFHTISRIQFWYLNIANKPNRCGFSGGSAILCLCCIFCSPPNEGCFFQASIFFHENWMVTGRLHSYHVMFCKNTKKQIQPANLLLLSNKKHHTKQSHEFI